VKVCTVMGRGTWKLEPGRVPNFTLSVFRKAERESQILILSESPKDAQKSALPSSSTVPVRNEKKAAKKARAKKSKAESDELDQILAELSLQYVAHFVR
jgi:hypothetical protein